MIDNMYYILYDIYCIYYTLYDNNNSTNNTVSLDRRVASFAGGAHHQRAK